MPGNLNVWVVVVGILGVFVAMRFFNANRSDETIRRLVAYASSRGWSYTPTDPALVRSWSGPPFTGRGDATQVMAGTADGCDFTSFEYTWTDHSGDHQIDYHYLVAAVRLPVVLPLQWILPQTAANRLSNPLGAHDITLESAQFNDAFMVTADNDRYAYAVVSQQVMARLLDTSLGSRPIRIEGNHVLTWDDGE